MVDTELLLNSRIAIATKVKYRRNYILKLIWGHVVNMAVIFAITDETYKAKNKLHFKFTEKM